MGGAHSKMNSEDIISDLNKYKTQVDITKNPYLLASIDNIITKIKKIQNVYEYK